MRHILDWWHLSVRVRHVEQALAGVYALQLEHKAGLDPISVDVERLRHLLWNGYAAKASEILCAIRRPVKEAIRVNGKRFGPAVRRFLYRCQDLDTYLTNNDSTLIDYGRHSRAGRAISTSRAEGLVDELANARMAKCRRMRWSPRGAHCVATVRAAVLDGRLTSSMPTRSVA